MISGLPHETPLFSSIGLERVDLTTLHNEQYLSAPVPAMDGQYPKSSMDGTLLKGVCPEVPPTLLPGLLWQAAGFSGPTVIQVAACAASAIAIGTAFRTIRSGFFRGAVAGGVDSMIFPYGFHAFNSLGALSERNDLGPAALAPFDLHRSGTLLGEGAAYLALESEQSLDTTKHDPIAEIIGYGSSMDAFHSVMPDPDGKGAIKAMQNALNDAHLTPQHVDYINAHGTGTPHNDKMEAKAMQTLFGQRAAALPISSIKPFVGHLLSAAGAIEAAASILPFLRGLIPPTLHYSTPDPDCPVDCVPNTARKANVNIVMTNSYGFGGQNASLIFRKIR